MKAAGSSAQHHYLCPVNYHLIGAHSSRASVVPLAFNNAHVLILFLSLWRATHCLNWEWTWTQARVDKEIWVEHGWRDRSVETCRHKKADLVIVDPQRGLSCNEAHARVRAGFLPKAASSFFFCCVKKMCSSRWGASWEQALRRLVRATQECDPLTA